MKKIFLIAFTFFVAICLNACLEDKGYTDVINSKGNGPVVSLFGSELGLYAQAVPISSQEHVNVTITAARVSKDITVNFVLQSQAVIDQYNIAQAKALGDTLPNGSPAFKKYDPFDILPLSVYDIPSMSITIPAGTKDGDLVINVNSSKMSLTDNYILPLIIESVEGDPNVSIAENKKQILLNVQAKNRFDGNYNVKGAMADAVNSALTGAYPWDVSLVTKGANQVLLVDRSKTFSGDQIWHLIMNGTAFSTYGTFGVLINFDLNNNVTSVENYWGTGTPPTSPNGRSAQIDPSGENKWNPATKTLKIKYWMNQPGSSHRTSFDETYTYSGVR